MTDSVDSQHSETAQESCVCRGEARPTIHRCAGLIDEAVPLNHAVGVHGLPPGYVYRRCGELTEVDEAGRAGC